MKNQKQPKSSLQRRKKLSTQTGTDKKLFQTKKSNFAVAIVAILCGLSFFIHELIPGGKTTQFLESEQVYIAAKSERTKALNVLKDKAVNTPEYDKYLIEKEKTAKAYETYNQIAEKESFRGFQNFQQFLGEFGWALGLFIYAFFNLFTALHEKRQHLSLMHSVLLFISIFYLFYVFQPFQDLSKMAYIVAAVVSAIAIALATHYYIRHAFAHVEMLKRKVRLLVGFVARTTNSEDKTEMWDVLDEVSN